MNTYKFRTLEKGRVYHIFLWADDFSQAIKTMEKIYKKDEFVFEHEFTQSIVDLTESKN